MKKITIQGKCAASESQIKLKIFFWGILTLQLDKFLKQNKPNTDSSDGVYLEVFVCYNRLKFCRQ